MEKINIALKHMKYMGLLKKTQEQISVFYKGLERIQKKLVLYCLPLKYDLVMTDPKIDKIKVAGLEAV